MDITSVIGVFKSVIDLTEWMRSRFKKLYRFRETFEYRRLEKPWHLEYYPESEDKMFAFKVSPIPRDKRPVFREVLTVTLLNTDSKPVKIIDAFIEDSHGHKLDLFLLHEDLPAEIKAFVGEFSVSMIVDQIWAYTTILDKRFTHPFAALFVFDNLPVLPRTLVLQFADGRFVRHKLSQEVLQQLSEKINPKPKIRVPFSRGTTCSVENCEGLADYIVLLYDHYDDGFTFLEQDFTCPFICEKHLQENERGIGNKGVGERRYPRGPNVYPYTNQAGAQGYTKYIPLHLEEEKP